MPSLENAEWQLLAWSDKNLTARTVITAFFQGGRLTGSDGCNRYTTSYRGQGKALQINPQISTTRRACPPEIMEQSSQFLTRLGAATQYRITPKGNLEITYQKKGKRGVMILIPKAQSKTSSALLEKTWHLTSLNGKPLLPNSSITLELEGDRLAGTGGCNRFTGSYNLEERKLSVDPDIASTMKACEPEIMEQESAFLQALAAATEYLIDNRGNLQLSYQLKGQRGILTFSPNLPS
jgi:heat shock protein HslJ